MNELVDSFMDRAESALESADILLQNDQFLALANRAYYAIFYCICALLATEEVYVKKHQAARNKFGELFVNSGRFPKEASQIVGRTFNARQSADYDMETDVTSDQAHVLMTNAQTFYNLTVAYLSNRSSI